MNPWILLAFAIVFEVIGTMSLKASNGLTRALPSLMTLIFYAGSFSLLAIALKKIDVGVAYAIWGGVGIGLIALISAFFYGESFSPAKVVSLCLIIAGVVGLNLTGTAH